MSKSEGWGGRWSNEYCVGDDDEMIVRCDVRGIGIGICLLV